MIGGVTRAHATNATDADTSLAISATDKATTCATTAMAAAITSQGTNKREFDEFTT